MIKWPNYIFPLVILISNFLSKLLVLLSVYCKQPTVTSIGVQEAKKRKREREKKLFTRLGFSVVIFDRMDPNQTMQSLSHTYQLSQFPWQLFIFRSKSILCPTVNWARRKVLQLIDLKISTFHCTHFLGKKKLEKYVAYFGVVVIVRSRNRRSDYKTNHFSRKLFISNRFHSQ